MDVFDLQAKISLDSSAFTNGLSAAASKAKTFAKVGIGVATAATVAVAGGFAAAAKSTAAYGDNVDKTSQKLGLSAEAFQKWDYVMKIAGTDMNSMGTGLKTLTNKLDEAKNGSSDAQEMFGKLGLSMEELGNMSREEVFEATIKGFQGLEDSTERAALANDLFGRSGQNLAPLFNQTAQQTEEQMALAEKYGMVMPEAAVKASAAFQDSMTTMQMTFTGMKNRLMGEFLPSITQVTDGLAMMFAGDYDEGLAKIDEGINAFVENINNILPKVLEIGGKILGSLANAIIENLPQLLSAAGQALKTLGKGFISNMPTIIKSGIQIIKTLISGLLQAIPELINSAGSIITELTNGLVQSLPELIPAVVDIILTIVQALIDNIGLVVDAAIQISMALAEGIINALPVLIEKVPEIVSSLAQAIIDNAPKLLNAGIQLIVMLATGIGSAIGQVLSMGAQAVGQFVSGIAGKVSAVIAKGKELVSKFIQGIKSFFGKLLSTGKGAIDAVKNGITGKVGQALKWGKDLMSNLIGGIKSKIGELANVVSNVGGKIKSLLGFSEPEEGPLSDFHTYAPDMMDLFIKGIKDNRRKLINETKKAFDLKNVIQGGVALSGNTTGYTNNFYITIDGSRGSEDVVESLIKQIELRTRMA